MYIYIYISKNELIFNFLEDHVTSIMKKFNAMQRTKFRENEIVPSENVLIV